MFLLQRHPPGDTSSLAYLFGCGGKGKAIAVDVHQVVFAVQDCPQSLSPPWHLRNVSIPL